MEDFNLDLDGFNVEDVLFSEEEKVGYGGVKDVKEEKRPVSLTTIVETAFRSYKDVSDLYLTPNAPVCVKCSKGLKELPITLTADEVQNLVFGLLNEQQRAQLESELEVDFSFRMHKRKFRGNAFFSKRQVCAVLRALKLTPPPFSTLGLPDVILTLKNAKKGLILVTGPTGSGKSTTLASLIQEALMDEPKVLVTVEDPVEYEFNRYKGVVFQRDLEYDTKSFARALKSALREAPDLILVGEIRDRETAKIALQASETGHLVFSTLHTNSAVETVVRLVNMFPLDSRAEVLNQLSFVLRGVVSQRLLVKKDLSGKVAAVEVFIPNDAARALIREGKIEQINSYFESWKKETGSILMEESLAKLVKENLITKEVAFLNASDKDRLKRFLLKP